MAENPWEQIAHSQRAAAELFADSVNRMMDLGRTGATRPDEVLKDFTALAAALGEFAGSTAKPLEAFVASQRELAETLSASATLQRQLADVTEKAAAHQAAMVQALEMMTAPVTGFAQLLRGEQRR